MSKNDIDSSVTMRDMAIFNKIRNFIRRKINNSSRIYYDETSQRNEVFELIKRSIEFRESNSAIICGPPGSGKTTLIASVLEELTDDNIINKDSVSIVRLNGLLHTDDRLALQDIIRQLNVAEGLPEGTSYSFQENLVKVLEKLKERIKDGNVQPYSIFVLDDFHLFCSHKNQILLYNLFDIVQSAKAPIFVIGLTYCTDVMDLMEKRVLSRFSHRLIWLNQNITIEGRLRLFKNILTLKPKDLCDVDEIYKVLWNIRTDELIENKEVVDSIKRQMDINPSQTKFRNIMFSLFNTVTFELPLLTVENVKKAFVNPDYHSVILSGLSLFEMALLIAIKHQTTTYEREPFNFEMIFTQYLKFCNKNSTTLITDRSVVLKAFQRLQELEIVVPVKKTYKNAIEKVPLEYQQHNLSLTEDQIAEAVKACSEISTELRQWALFGIP